MESKIVRQKKSLSNKHRQTMFYDYNRYVMHIQRVVEIGCNILILFSRRLTLAGAGVAAATTLVLASPSALRKVGLE